MLTPFHALLGRSYGSVVPPSFTSLSHLIGDPAGGFNLAAVGTDFLSGIVCEIVQGTSLVVATAGVTYNSATSLTLAMPAVAAGLYTIRLRNPDGGQVDYNSYFEYWTPASLSLDGWYRNFTALPKASAASAGSSGSAPSMLLANGTPTYSSLSFGSAGAGGAIVSSGSSAQSISGVNFLVAPTATTIIALFERAASPSAAGGNFYDEAAIATDNGGNWGLTSTSSGVRCGVYNGATRQTQFLACAAGWHVLAGRWDTSDVAVILDGAIANPTTPWTGGSGPIAANLHVGKNWTSGAFLASGAKLAELMFAKSSIANATIAKTRAYWRAMYQGLSLP